MILGISRKNKTYAITRHKSYHLFHVKRFSFTALYASTISNTNNHTKGVKKEI